MNLAACYGPKDISDDEEVNPLLLPYLHLIRCQPFSRICKLQSSAQVQMSSAYPLPVAYPDYGYQEGPLLTLWFPHFRALLLCPTRSLFRVVGSSSRMDGGIISYGVPQLSWRLRVARGSLQEGTECHRETLQPFTSLGCSQ